jgi:hypothetical protein
MVSPTVPKLREAMDQKSWQPAITVAMDGGVTCGQVIGFEIAATDTDVPMIKLGIQPNIDTEGNIEPAEACIGTMEMGGFAPLCGSPMMLVLKDGSVRLYFNPQFLSELNGFANDPFDVPNGVQLDDVTFAIGPLAKETSGGHPIEVLVVDLPGAGPVTFIGTQGE